MKAPKPVFHPPPPSSGDKVADESIFFSLITNSTFGFRVFPTRIHFEFFFLRFKFTPANDIQRW